MPLAFLALRSSRRSGPWRRSHRAFGTGMGWRSSPATARKAGPPPAPSAGSSGSGSGGSSLDFCYQRLLWVERTGLPKCRSTDPSNTPFELNRERKKAFISCIPVGGCCFPRGSLVPSDNSL